MSVCFASPLWGRREYSGLGRGDADDFAIGAEECRIIRKAALFIGNGRFDTFLDERVGEQDLFGAHVLNDRNVHATQKFFAYVGL